MKKGKDKNSRKNLRAESHYRFDNLMSRGILAKIGTLLAVTLLVVILFGLIDYAVNPDSSILHSIWITLMHTFDAGNLADENDSPLSIKLIMLLATLFGMFFTATLIGIINTGLEQRMDRLEHGKSKVLEHGHTIILGFNPVTLSIIHELVLANENHDHQVIVVMDPDHEKTDMEYAIHNYLEPDNYSSTESWKTIRAAQKARRQLLRHTRIVCRKGHVYVPDDLAMCSLDTCRSVILNAEDDAQTIKAVMACAAVIDEMKHNGKTDLPYITAVIRNRNNMDSAIIAGRGYLEVVCYQDLMSRIMANSSRQAGLSQVFTELFNYEDNEIYCVNVKDIALPEGVKIENLGKYEINQYLKNGIAIGGIPKEQKHPFSADEQLQMDFYGTSDDRKKMPSCMFPSMKQKTLAGLEKLYILQADDYPKTECVSKVSSDMHALPSCDCHRSSGMLVILGHSPLIPSVLDELNGFLASGTRILILDHDVVNMDKQEQRSDLFIQYQQADIDDYRALKQSVPEETASVLILAQHPEEEEKPDMRQSIQEQADELTLSRLMFMRQIRKDRHTPFSITCEMNLDQNRALAEYSNAEDFIVGSTVTAMIITQIAQTIEVHRAFREILEPAGSELYMRNASDVLYFKPGQETITCSIYDLSRALAEKNEVLIGLRIIEEGTEHLYSRPLVNPPKWTDDSCTELMKYEISRMDQLIVIAED